uniref:Chloride channel protein n=1 Tax=Branchiostoma floridae TaxID=7739 RepID=C3ZAT4_BRAFL|eukprot:XP_002593960.1 hypothetical protein BRAFLDRAFT_68603 [Branchiostoma floridae]
MTLRVVDYVFKNLISTLRRLDWDRWVMMGLIGFSVGFLGFLLHQIIEIISEYKWDKAEDFIKEGDIAVAYIWVLGYSLLLVIVGSGLVVYLRPSAGGSGMPELIGFLNGTVVRHIFNVKTFVVKFLSCACAVASGLPVGPEGPMIHMGGLIGAGLSQFRSGTLGFSLPFFERFRNSEDRRNFIQAGAGAGVASAFGAPVGGLLFAMEEVSSFWNMKLTWQTFFCCMIATFTTDLFNSAFTSFQYKGSFGLFRAEKYILFQVRNEIPVNILAFIPTVVLGVLGGLLGGLFTFCNLKIVRGRRALLAKLSSDWKRKLVRISELCLIISVADLAHLLLDTPHGGFPVVHSSQEGQEKTFYGMITRIELSVILFHPELFETIENPSPEDPEVTLLDYQQTTIHKLYNTDEIEDLLTKFCDDPVYDQQFVNLQPYVNQSALSVRDNFSLHRTYIIFRTLGLRHLTVVDETNKVVGIITRKDLMGFQLEESLGRVRQEVTLATNVPMEMAEHWM